MLRIAESHRRQLRGDRLDAFNHFNFGSPKATIAHLRDGGLPNPNAGRILGGSGSRIIQVWPEVHVLSLQENLTRERCQARARESYVLLRRFGPYRFSDRVTCSASARQLPGKADRSLDIDFALPMSPQAP